ncbi:MAG: hypothetical protein V1896_02805 [Candidatus Zambryskibacteria bacterium]
MMEGPTKNEDKKPEESQETQPLSPEVLEKVMEKVEDINGDRVGVTILGILDYFNPEIGNISRLQSVLSNGLLGRSVSGKIQKPEVSKEEWAKEVKEHKKDELVQDQPNIYFTKPDSTTEIEIAEVKRYRDYDPKETFRENMYVQRGGYAIAFDLRNLNFKGGWFKEKNIDYKSKTYMFDPRSGGEKHSLNRFVTKIRVAPRKFKGIIVYPFKRKYTDEEIERELDIDESIDHSRALRRNERRIDYRRQKTEDTSSERMEKELKDVVDMQMVTFGEKTDLLIPVYDADGNMLWPKRMSYEEVKKFVEERDKKKEEEKNEK